MSVTSAKRASVARSCSTSSAVARTRPQSRFSCLPLNAGGGRRLAAFSGQKYQRPYIEDAVECAYRIVENRGGVCDRQIFNIGSPSNEVSIRELAELMREIYAEKFHDSRTQLPDIVSVSGETFYGRGYEDSDRRIPDIAKARTLLGWEPRWRLRELLEATMSYYVNEYPRARPVGAAS